MAAADTGVRRWLVLFGCFVGMALAPPAILMLPMGLFLKSMTAEFGWSRTQFSSIISIAALCNALVMPAAGYLVDRFGVRPVVAVGTLLGCSSYAALSLATGYGGFVVILVLAVLTGNLASYPSFMALTQRWFDRNLGFALAITSTGLAVGTAAFSYFITQTIAAQGWRQAFLLTGLAALVIGLANVALFVRDRPRSALALAPGEGGGARDAAPEATLGAALKTSDFWLYSASFTLIIFAVVGCNFHLPAMLSDRGAAPAAIAGVVAAGSAGSLFGRLFTGFLLDRLSVRLVAAVFFVGQAIGFVLLLGGLSWALLAGFLLGAVQGAEIDVMGYVIARRFGRAAYARIYGTCFGITLAGAIIGPLVMAAVFDRTGSYGSGLLLLPLAPLAAIGLLWLATPLKTERGVKAGTPVAAP